VNGERREQLRQRLLGLGFDVVRFASAGVAPDCGLLGWLAAGNHADMAWLERTADKRLDPQQVLPGAATVIALGVNYWPGLDGARGHFARYALHADYHDTIRPALEAAGRELEKSCGIASTDYRYYVDAGPVMERGWAAAAGLGFSRKERQPDRAGLRQLAVAGGGSGARGDRAGRGAFGGTGAYGVALRQVHALRGGVPDGALSAPAWSMRAVHQLPHDREPRLCSSRAAGKVWCSGVWLR
jgi:hypothetical protein